MEQFKEILFSFLEDNNFVPSKNNCLNREISYYRRSHNNKAAIVIHSSFIAGQQYIPNKDPVRINIIGCLGKLTSGKYDLRNLHTEPSIRLYSDTEIILKRLAQRINASQEWLDKRIAKINCDKCGSLVWNGSYQCIKENWRE